MNYEHAAGGTPSDDDFSQLLQDAEQREAKNNKTVTMIEVIQESVERDLERYGVPTVTRRSVASEVYADAMEREAEKYLAEYGEHIDPQAQHRMAIHALNIRELDDSALITKVMIAKVAHSSAVEHGDVVDEAAEDANKRDVIGECLYRRQLPFSSKWVDFLNASLPGKNVTEDQLESMLVEQAEVAANQARRSHEMQARHAKALQKAGLDGLTEESPERSFQLFASALGLSKFEKPEHERRAELDETARSLGMDSERVWRYFQQFCDSDEHDV